MMGLAGSYAFSRKKKMNVRCIFNERSFPSQRMFMHVRLNLRSQWADSTLRFL